MLSAFAAAALAVAQSPAVPEAASPDLRPVVSVTGLPCLLERRVEMEFNRLSLADILKRFSEEQGVSFVAEASADETSYAHIVLPNVALSTAVATIAENYSRDVSVVDGIVVLVRRNPELRRAQKAGARMAELPKGRRPSLSVEPALRAIPPHLLGKSGRPLKPVGRIDVATPACDLMSLAKEIAKRTGVRIKLADDKQLRSRACSVFARDVSVPQVLDAVCRAVGAYAGLDEESPREQKGPGPYVVSLEGPGQQAGQMLSDSLRPILVGLLPSAEASRYVQGEPMRVRYAKLPSELQNRCLALYNLKLQSAKQEARDADLLGARDLKLVLQKPLRVIDFEYTKPDGSVLRM